MEFELSEEHRMLKDLVHRFVTDQLMPLEAGVLAREAAGQGMFLAEAEHKRIDEVSKKLGLWGLDAPSDIGGSDLPAVALIGVNEELGRTITPYTLPPDSPNLRMLMATVDAAPTRSLSRTLCARRNRVGDRHLRAGGGLRSAAMTTRAERAGDDWIINGRKIWISRADHADFTILMAVTDRENARAAASPHSSSTRIRRGSMSCDAFR